MLGSTVKPQASCPAVYRPRRPARTVLHKVVRENLQTYLEASDTDGDGFIASGQIQMFTSTETWWRLVLLLRFEKKIGRTFFRHRANYFSGNNLNTVSQFLVGGHWDTPGLRSLPGYSYAQYRVDEDLLLNAGVDYTIMKGLEVDVRSAYFLSGGEHYWDISTKVSTIWNGIGLNFGVGYPIGGSVPAKERNVTLYGSLSCALLGL